VQSELERFVRYIRRENASFITTEVTRRWITGATDSRRWRSYLVYMVRGFARYLSAVDPRTEIPPADLFIHHQSRKAPYIYSKLEVARLVAAARKLPASDKLRPATYATLFGLLATTGLRIGEAIALTREHVNLEQGVLTIDA